jgi:hypothetical protein
MKVVWDTKEDKKRAIIYHLYRYAGLKRKEVCCFLDRAEAKSTLAYCRMCFPEAKWTTMPQTCP